MRSTIPAVSDDVAVHIEQLVLERGAARVDDEYSHARASGRSTALRETLIFVIGHARHKHVRCRTPQRIHQRHAATTLLKISIFASTAMAKRPTRSRAPVPRA
jgi:hypothetical protein